MYEELLTVEQVADLLKISKVSVYRMAKVGRLKAVRIGSAVRFRPSEIGVEKLNEEPPTKPEVERAQVLPKTSIPLLESLMPEIEKVFRYVPAYGDISIRVIMHDAAPVSIETASSVSMLLGPKSEQAHSAQNRPPRR
jgi:excisionase family DNA binding protein